MPSAQPTSAPTLEQLLKVTVVADYSFRGSPTVNTFECIVRDEDVEDMEDMEDMEDVSATSPSTASDEHQSTWTGLLVCVGSALGLASIGIMNHYYGQKQSPKDEHEFQKPLLDPHTQYARV